MTDFETVDYSRLETLNLALNNYFAHSLPNGRLYKSTIDDLANYLAPFVSALGESGFVPISALALPTPLTNNNYSIVAAGTYTQSGQPDLIATGTLNIISWNGTAWALIKAIDIDLTGYPTLDQAALKVNIVGDVNQEIGVQTSGVSADDSGAIDFYKTNTNSISQINGLVSTAIALFSSPGTFYISIIRPFDGGAELIKTLPMFTESLSGFRSIVINEPLKVGETLAFGGGVGTAQIAFATSGGPADNRLIQYPRSGSPMLLPLGSYYTFFYNIKEYLKTGFEDYISKTEFPQFLIDYASSDNVSETASEIGYKGSFDNTLFITDQQIITTDQACPYNCAVPTVTVNMEQAGNLTFSIGLLDQYGYWVEDRSFTRFVQVGLNNLDVNISLIKGQRIALKAPIPAIRVKNGAGSYWKSQSVGYGSVLQKVTTGALLFGYSIYQTFEIPFAKSSEFNELKADVNSLKDKSAIVRSVPSGLKFRLVCDDDGTNVRGEAIGSTMAVLGNSITIHPITSFWWGTFGMAASERSKDYVHVLETRMKANEPASLVSPLNISDWEQNRNTFNLNSVNPIITGKDYIVIRLGENVSDLTNYEADIVTLINHCKTVNPTAIIATTGNFWANPTKDNAMKAASLTTNSQYIDFDGLDIPENKSFIGAIIRGDDGLDHVVDNAGVAIHPGDLGMQRISDRIYTALF